ncbi:MAG: hypothetical protein K6T88_10305 [Bacillus sp. (in: Bacteria)]|nr:hypothetical protein [Bacillus sp. (in: firmicutes)]
MYRMLVLSMFLYFPEDKSEYFPAAITSVLFLIGAILTMRYFIKVSKREAKKAEELEEQLKIKQPTQRNS